MHRSNHGSWYTEGLRVYKRGEEPSEVVCEVYPWGKDKGEANAHLIAAAPAMKQALEAVVGVYRDDEESAKLGRTVLHMSAPMYARRCLLALYMSNGVEDLP